MQEIEKSAGPAYGGSFVASLISAFTLALIFHGLRVFPKKEGFGRRRTP